MTDRTGSTPPHHARPSAQQLDEAFDRYSHLPRVRDIHALYVEAAVALLRVVRRMEALGEPVQAFMLQALVVQVEQMARRQIEAIGARYAVGNGGGGHP